MSSESRPDTEFEPERVVIRDNRKIDRDAAAATPAAGGTAGDRSAPPAEPAAASPAEDETVPKAEALLLEERTRDLQRVSAEYANYRKRAERDRLAAGELAIGRALAELLPVVDDLDRAEAHGDLTGPLKAVADKLEAAFAKLGLVAFGEVGDPFDPALHEAVMHDESDDVALPTCTTVLRPGYKHHERLLRPAMVGVTDPATPTTPVASPVDSVSAADGGSTVDSDAVSDPAADAAQQG
ncbi:nucleotide exchange factor GrpE [uncultured Jatrophihabitans sp.]|uniref:nucleotide exchange factor GrpE n=1 Tax=uncultured Jatrophihabitans sp. TaxID=1610747 RepID=UPI0035CBC34A